MKQVELAARVNLLEDLNSFIKILPGGESLYRDKRGRFTTIRSVIAKRDFEYDMAVAAMSWFIASTS